MQDSPLHLSISLLKFLLLRFSYKSESGRTELFIRSFIMFLRQPKLNLIKYRRPKHNTMVERDESGMSSDMVKYACGLPYRAGKILPIFPRNIRPAKRDVTANKV